MSSDGERLLKSITEILLEETAEALFLGRKEDIWRLKNFHSLAEKFAKNLIKTVYILCNNVYTWCIPADDDPPELKILCIIAEELNDREDCIESYKDFVKLYKKQLKITKHIFNLTLQNFISAIEDTLDIENNIP